MNRYSKYTVRRWYAIQETYYNVISFTWKKLLNIFLTLISWSSEFLKYKMGRHQIQYPILTMRRKWPSSTRIACSHHSGHWFHFEPFSVKSASKPTNEAIGTHLESASRAERLERPIRTEGAWDGSNVHRLTFTDALGKCAGWPFSQCESPQ